jgi:hypothetical protein
MCRFYAHRSQKCKKILTTWLNSDDFVSYTRKRCSMRVDEIDPRCQFHQCFTSSFYACRSLKRLKTWLSFFVHSGSAAKALMAKFSLSLNVFSHYLFFLTLKFSTWWPLTQWFQAQCFIDMYENYTVPELEPILGEDAHVSLNLI